jgi:hypothetical protein
MITRDWRDYNEQWTPGDITDEAISHPAKFNRGLIKRIYAHLLAQGYIQPGQIILDPFGGVALGAADALQAGLNWIGVELEQNFADMGGGCDCTGMSKTDWARFYGRWGKAAYKDGRHWCPRCLAQAGQVTGGNGHLPAKSKRLARIAVLEEATGRKVQRYPLMPFPDTKLGALAMARQPAMFAAEPSTAYRHNSGEIPHSEPHHYAGNVELFARHARNGATATLLQGDSRRLRQVVMGAQGVCSSPPYIRSHIGADDNPYIDVPGGRLGTSQTAHLVGNDNYGSTPSNLGNLPPGDWQAVIGSPPYASSVHDGNGIDADRLTGNPAGPNSQAFAGGYGRTEGQLGAMHACGSPPFAASLASDDPDRRGGLFADPKRRNDRTLTAEYGSSAGQLGRMNAVGSPPFENNNPKANGKQGKGWYSGQDLSQGLNRLKDDYQGYESQDSLGNSGGDDFWSAASAIMAEVAAILEPGACAVWVVKSFVRDGAIVDFPGQWAALGEAHGFETVEWIRAHLVEERGTQLTLDGGAKKKRTARKSFFRNLYEQKHPENAIDHEIVIIQVRR